MEDQERERAEVFDALAHPTRISILRLLSHEALSFADLKKKTDIVSSGHLQHHLTKLYGLITTDEHGNYRLSDAGNDALFAMQTVEAVSRKGRRRPISDSRKPRMLLSTVVVALTVCIAVSTLYLSNIAVSLNQYAAQTLTTAQNQYANLTQYAAQNQYVADIMTGSLQERGRLRIERILPIELAPQEWFNYTAVVISEFNYSGVGYVFSNWSTVDVFSPPVHNDTYYKQGFLKYELQVYGPKGGDVYYAHMYPIIGPDGWDRQVVSPFSPEIPPYITRKTSDDSTGTLSGGIPYSFVSIVPISTFGNYTFCVRNEGNTTMQIYYKVTTPVVTLETKPLEEANYPAWSPNYAEEKIVRIRQQSGFTQPPPAAPTLSTDIPDTTLTAFNIAALAIFSATILGILSIFTINRKKIWRARSDSAG